MSQRKTVIYFNPYKWKYPYNAEMEYLRSRRVLKKRKERCLMAQKEIDRERAKRE